MIFPLSKLIIFKAHDISESTYQIQLIHYADDYHRMKSGLLIIKIIYDNCKHIGRFMDFQNKSEENKILITFRRSTKS